MTISAPYIYLGLKHWEKRVFLEKQRLILSTTEKEAIHLNRVCPFIFDYLSDCLDTNLHAHSMKLTAAGSLAI